jgi:hypothetical protein
MILRIGHFFSPDGDGGTTVRPVMETLSVNLEQHVENSKNRLSIALSDNIVLAACSSGKLFQLGAGFYDETLPIRSKPNESTCVPTASDGVSAMVAVHWPREPVTSVSIGCGFVAAVCEDGSVYSWGCNRYQQLGIGNCGRPGCGACTAEGASSSDSSPPPSPAVALSSPTAAVLPSTFDTVASVVCGKDHMMALTTRGTVYSCGRGSLGQLGTSSPCEFTCALLPVTFPLDVFVTSIAAGLCVRERIGMGCPCFHGVWLSRLVSQCSSDVMWSTVHVGVESVLAAGSW